MGVLSQNAPIYGGVFVNILQIYHRYKCELHHVAPCDEARKGDPVVLNDTIPNEQYTLTAKRIG